MKKIAIISILILTLTISLVGFCICAQATVADVIVVQYGQCIWQYYKSYDHLQLWQQYARGVGFGADIQYDIATQLCQQGYATDVAYSYVLPQFDKLLAQVNTVAVARQDATVQFAPDNASKFVYHSGIDGIAIDIDQLAYRLLGAGNGETVQLPVKTDSAITVEQLKANTVVRGSFCTSYSNRTNRVANIRRASSLIRGSVVDVGQSWSFNDVVGQRTLDNGFLPSTVISDGIYAEGIGGGVCQVSTTMYNALLMADVSVTRVCQHSLVPSYIEPSFDAMVSYPYADLCFVNNTDMPIYVDCTATTSDITVTIYGTPNNYFIVRNSTVDSRQSFDTTYIVDAEKYPELIYTTDTRQIVSGSDGVVSYGNIDRYINGEIVSSTKPRKCTYKKVDRVLAQGEIEPPRSILDILEYFQQQQQQQQ